MMKKILVACLAVALICLSGIPSARAEKQAAIVDINGQGDYVSLEAALANHERNIYMKPGIYNVSDTLFIRSSDTTLTGESAESVILRQTNPESDLLAVTGANRVTISNLTLDTETHNAWSALVEADSNFLTVRKTIIRGSTRSFAVYFAGPAVPAGKKSLDAVEHNRLDSNNVFENNSVYSGFHGDALSFSLQKNGRVSGNQMHRAMIAFYLCRDSIVSDNIITDSPSAGIAYSLPSYDNKIIHNTIIRAQRSGIRVSRNLEHEVPTTARYGGLHIEGNTIADTRFFGLELDQLADNSRIVNNKIQNTDFFGIQVMRSTGLFISGNDISSFGQWKQRGKLYNWNSDSNGIILEGDVQNSMVAGNRIASRKGYGDFGIRVMPAASGNTVSGNVFSGTFAQLPIWVEGNNRSQ